MLSLDIGRLTESELAEAVCRRCAQFGTIRNVKVHAVTDDRGYGIATVEMSTPHEADKVAVKIGDLKFDSTAIIRLIQKDKPIPVALNSDAGYAIACATYPPEILLVED